MRSLMYFQAIGSGVLLTTAREAAYEWFKALMFHEMRIKMAFGDEVLATFFADKRSLSCLKNEQVAYM